MIRAKVISTWQKLSPTERKEIRRLAMRAKDAGMRCRCKVILALVQGRTPTMIAQGGLCAKSQVYRVAERFIEQGLAGLADRREDNGECKITEAYEIELLRLVDGSPQEFGYRRPTWTQELLSLGPRRTDRHIASASSAMSRLLGRLGIRLKRPKPIVNCPWKKARRTRRLRAIRRLVENLPAGEVVLYLDEVDIHLNPKIGPDWTKRPGSRRCSDSRMQPEALPCRCVESQDGPAHLCRRRAEEQPAVPGTAPQAWPRRPTPSAKRIHIILDNYGIHDSLQVRLALKSEAARKLKLHFLPPYCPDHNRIERIWKDLHDNVTRNHRCTTMEELMAEVR